MDCFNSTCDMKISYVKLIFIYKCPVSYVLHMFRIPRFHMWNFEPVHSTCELAISYVKTFPFHMWNENFMYENVPIPYIFHSWTNMWNFPYSNQGLFFFTFSWRHSLLYSLIQNEMTSACLCTTRENEAHPSGVCAGYVLFYKRLKYKRLKYIAVYNIEVCNYRSI